MKTTVQTIDERVVRHIARKHYDMTFCEEYAMRQRNQGKITWLPATLAVIMTLACASAPFMLKGQDQMIASVFAIIFGSGFLYSAIMFCAQERRHNRRWKEIKHQVGQFKAMINCPLNECWGWDELLLATQQILTGLGTKLVSSEIQLESLKYSVNELQSLLKDKAHRMSAKEKIEEGTRILNYKTYINEEIQHVDSLREDSQGFFDLAKYALGDPLDNGHGFGAFIRGVEKGVRANAETQKAEVLAQLA